MGIFQKNKGQEAIEFVLISGLVIAVSLLVVFTLGGKLASLFTGEKSTIEAVSKQTNVISPTSEPKFTQDYQTDSVIAANASHLSSFPTTTQQLEDIEAIAELVKTTGASGTTDTITKELDSIVAQLDTIIENQDINPTLAADVEAIAQSGHLIADAEEWYEFAIQRLESADGILLPTDNQICENGEIVGETSYCDQHVGDLRFLYNEKSVLSDNLSKYLTKMQTANTSFAGKIDPSNPAEVALANKVAILTQQIEAIAIDVKDSSNQIIEEKLKTVKMETFYERIASRLTDRKSATISETASPENIVTPEL